MLNSARSAVLIVYSVMSLNTSAILTANLYLKESLRLGRYWIYGLLAKPENLISVHVTPSNSEEDVSSRCAFSPPVSVIIVQEVPETLARI